MSDEFVLGNEYFLGDGRKAILEGVLTDGRYLVSELVWREGSYNEYPDYTEKGSSIVVNVLFKEEPTPAFGPLHTEQRDILKDIERQVSIVECRRAELMAEIRDATEERTRILAKLMQVPALKRIEDYIDGKMTHCVVEQYGSLEIKTLEDVLKEGTGYRRDMKLLTLFGCTNGDLSWGLNTYRDGSGGNVNIHLCMSHEHAVETAKQVALSKLTDNSLGENGYYAKKYLDLCIELGAEIPAEIRQKAEELAAKYKQTEINKIKDELNAVKSRLEKAEGVSA